MHSDTPADTKARAIRIHGRAKDFLLSAALFAAVVPVVIFVLNPILLGVEEREAVGAIDSMVFDLVRAFYLYATAAIAAASLLIGLILLLWSNRLSRASRPS